MRQARSGKGTGAQVPTGPHPGPPSEGSAFQEPMPQPADRPVDQQSRVLTSSPNPVFNKRVFTAFSFFIPLSLCVYNILSGI